MHEIDFEKLKLLEIEIKSYGNCLVALSGGVDSCLISYLSRKFLGKENTVAVISNSASLKKNDLNIAINFCEKHDINYELVQTNELANEDYNSNPSNRCYFCKNELYEALNKLSNEKYTGYSIINGNNFSDLGDYRPGLVSADENSIKSPFIKCEVSKENIRNIAKYFDLEVWDKPASPCLSSRFPYGESITYEKLKMVEKAESILNEFGFNDVRVRTSDTTAKIEVPNKEIGKLKKVFNKVQSRLYDLGYSQCLIDEEGLVSGKLNRVLNEL